MGRRDASLGDAPDPGQKTRDGCYCSSTCGATPDFDSSKYDWCYTRDRCGSYSITRLSYYDWCVYPADPLFEGRSARTKRDEIWNNIIFNQRSGTWGSVLGLFLMSVKTSFDNYWEIMPAGREKLIHGVGWVSQMTFKPAGTSPYTGIFASGSDYGLIRCSSAQPASKTDFTPGCAVKFFRDGVVSGNWFTMPSLDGQSDFNFFALDFTNHPAYPSGWSLQLLATKFTQASNCPLMVGLSDSATMDQRGNIVQPEFPFEIRLVPTGKVSFPSSYYDEVALGGHFQDIPRGTDLFYVYAYATPAAARAGSSEFLGTITTASNFVSSNWGDKNMFFRHTYQEHDFAVHPEWIDQIDQQAQCGTTKVTTVPP
jgi:hypothetical protein